MIVKVRAGGRKGAISSRPLPWMAAHESGAAFKENIVKTWKEIMGTLPTGMTESTVEEIRRLTAPERHQERTFAAVQAAVSWLHAEGHDENLCRALCWAEARGLYGGGSHDPGAGTIRHPAFRGLGSGRRQANDGPAWTAAIEAGSWCGKDERGYAVAPFPREDGVVSGDGLVAAWETMENILLPDEMGVLVRGLIMALPQRATFLAPFLDRANKGALETCGECKYFSLLDSDCRLADDSALTSASSPACHRGRRPRTVAEAAASAAAGRE